jgi:hypothetical protein
MTASDYIASVSLIIAFVAFIYSYLTNTKKYELASQYRTEILHWYGVTIEILIRLKLEAKDDFKDENLKRELLSKLSANIELGRFYFPNIDKGDNYGYMKAQAYKGYRNLILDFLVFSYRVFEKRDAKKYLAHSETLQARFTSEIFEIIDPKTFLMETKKHTNKTFTNNLSFEDFIKKEPSELESYLKNKNAEY